MQGSIRSSAAVVVTRGAGSALEVLLVERSASLAFFGGYWAFPGGAAEEIDRGGGGEDADLARAALRELFEETGLLVERPGAELDALERANLRRALAAGGERDEGVLGTARARWRELVQTMLATPRPIGRLTTPSFAPRRHRTLFLHLVARGTEEAAPCGDEIVALRWVRPGDALAEWRRGALRVAPPVLFLLEFLEAGDVEAFVAAACAAMAAVEAGRLHSSRFSPGVFTAPLATPTLPPATTTNCYLVGEERVFVVDPATYEESERARLFELLDGWHAAGRRVEGVLVTHHHHDHVGSVAAVAERYDVPVLAHARTLERLPRRPRTARALGDGDELDLGVAPDGRGGWRLRALFTPGHDQGHLAFVEDRYGAALVGDLLSTVSTIVIDPPEGHLATYLASLRRLAREPLTTLYPAHGPPRPAGRALVEAYLAHRSERERALLAALERGPREPDALLPEVYADTDPRLFALAARSLAANLEKLEQEGRVRRAPDGRWESCPD